jgi:hypothetical protein
VTGCLGPPRDSSFQVLEAPTVREADGLAMSWQVFQGPGSRVFWDVGWLPGCLNCGKRLPEAVTRDLDFDVQVLEAPAVLEADGLAVSRQVF